MPIKMSQEGSHCFPSLYFLPNKGGKGGLWSIFNFPSHSSIAFICFGSLQSRLDERNIDGYVRENKRVKNEYTLSLPLLDSIA